MTDVIPEFERTPRTLTERGPKLEAIADRLMQELPVRCIDCPIAFSLRCAISEADCWLPQTPRPIRDIQFHDTAVSTSILSSTAEQALRNIVKRANVQPGGGPAGEADSVCCQDPRGIQTANYDNL